MMNLSVRASLLVVIVLMMAACTSVPSQPPAQLQSTPGVFVIVQERTVQTPLYSVDAPAGWKIVKSNVAAEQAVVLVFAAADNTMTITVSDASLPVREVDAAFVQQVARVTLANGQTIALDGQAKRELASQLSAAFEAVRQSIRLPE